MPNALKAVCGCNVLWFTVLCVASLLLSLFPTSASAQKRWDPNPTHPKLVLACSEPLCYTMQSVFDAALIDFRQYRPETSKDTRIPTLPNLSLNLASVKCGLSVWANNVPMYVCAAQQPLAGADIWFRNMLQTAKILQPRWETRMQAEKNQHIVDLGPAGCTPTGHDGPYRGQCPLHIELTELPGGNAAVRLWMNSLTSSYLIPYESLPARPSISIAAR